MNGENNDPLKHSQEQGHETRDASIPGVIVLGGGCLFLIIAFGLVGSFIMFRFQVETHKGKEPATTEFQAVRSQLPAPPILERAGWINLKELRAAETKELETYGWIDKEKKTARIPVARAMDILAQRSQSGAIAAPPGIWVQPAQ
jgi:hypothetical protein